MPTIHEVYEKWKSSQSAIHIERAADGEHPLERGYIGEFAIDCWAAIRAAVEERCEWKPHYTQDHNDSSWYVDGWDTSCNKWQNLDETLDYDDAIHANFFEFCPYCRLKIEIKATEKEVT